MVRRCVGGRHGRGVRGRIGGLAGALQAKLVHESGTCLRPAVGVEARSRLGQPVCGLGTEFSARPERLVMRPVIGT